VLLEVGTGEGNGLCVGPGVQPEELARVALHGARVDCNLGGVLVEDDAQLESVAGVDTRGVCCDGGCQAALVAQCVCPSWCVWFVIGAWRGGLLINKG
jgi:hypothetical protein